MGYGPRDAEADIVATIGDGVYRDRDARRVVAAMRNSHSQNTPQLRATVEALGGDTRAIEDFLDIVAVRGWGGSEGSVNSQYQQDNSCPFILTSNLHPQGRASSRDWPRGQDYLAAITAFSCLFASFDLPGEQRLHTRIGDEERIYTVNRPPHSARVWVYGPGERVIGPLEAGDPDNLTGRPGVPGGGWAFSTGSFLLEILFFGSTLNLDTRKFWGPVLKLAFGQSGVNHRHLGFADEDVPPIRRWIRRNGDHPEGAEVLRRHISRWPGLMRRIFVERGRDGSILGWKSSRHNFNKPPDMVVRRNPDGSVDHYWPGDRRVLQGGPTSSVRSGRWKRGGPLTIKTAAFGICPETVTKVERPSGSDIVYRAVWGPQGFKEWRGRWAG